MRNFPHETQFTSSLTFIPCDATGYFFCIKNIKKNKNLKILGFSAKLYLRILGLAATPDLRVIFIILIITLNLHDPSLSRVTAIPDPIVLDVGLAARSCHISMIIKQID